MRAPPHFLMFAYFSGKVQPCEERAVIRNQSCSPHSLHRANVRIKYLTFNSYNGYFTLKISVVCCCTFQITCSLIQFQFNKDTNLLLLIFIFSHLVFKPALKSEKTQTLNHENATSHASRKTHRPTGDPKHVPKLGGSHC